MHRLPAVLFALILTLTACQAAPATSGTAEATPKPSASAPAATPQPSASAPAATPVPLTNGCSDIPLPAPEGLISGSFADVVTTHLLTRLAPRVADDATITGELNQPARVYVVEGPVTDSGYDWWQVIPEGGSFDNAVWVAAQGKDGEVWLRRAQDAQGTWHEVSRLDVKGGWPTTYRAAGVGGGMYFFGGEIGWPDWQPSKRSLAFNLADCRWEQVADLPHADDAPHAVAADGLLYVIRTDEGAAMQVYDPEANAWTEASGPPLLLAYGSAVIGMDGQLLAFNDAGTFVYDIAADAWDERSTGDPVIDRNCFDPSMTRCDSDAAAHLDDGAVAVLGSGASGLWRFDLDDLTWRRLGSPRVAYYNAGMAALPDGRLVVTGGYLAGSCAAPEPPWPEHEKAPKYGLVDAFDPLSGTWEALPPLPLELESTAPIVVDGQLYIVGLDRVVNRTGSESSLVRADVVVARYAPPASDVTAGRSPNLFGKGGCGG